MKIELKKVYFSEQLSEETNAFTADLWINDKKVAYVKNGGHGGCTDYRNYDASGRDLLQQAEKFCDALPDVIYGTHTLPMNLEFKIDLLFEAWLKAKEDKKNFNKGINYIDAKGVAMIITWKGQTIGKLLKRADGISLIRNTIRRIKSEGGTILNTNLGKLM